MSDSPAKSAAAILALFWDIACLRRGPEDLPVSWRALVTAIILQVVLGLVIGSILPQVPPRPGVTDHSVTLLVLDVVVPLLWGGVILQSIGRSERFLQMMLAIFGVQLIFQPLIVPAFWATLFFGKESAWMFFAQAVFLAASLWLTVVQARIVRAATDWPMFAAVAAVIAQGLAAYLIIFAMFPDMAELLKQSQ